MSTYLDRIRGQHDEIRSRIQTVTDAAASEDRDLTEDEFRSVTEDGAKATDLAAQIEALLEQETRAAKVAALAPVENRGVGGATTSPRDPGHYRSVNEGGENSFFGDMYRAKFNEDAAASQRLREHSQYRAGLSVAGTGGPGIVPPKWMTDLYLPLSRQNRVVSALVTHLALGNDPRPIVLPKQTAGTDAVVATQTENAAVSGADAFNTATETLTPAAIAGKQTASRQLVDSATPAVDQLIFADLLSVYDAQIEALVNSAVVTAATAVTTFADDATTAGATHWGAVAASSGVNSTNALVDLQTALWASRFLPAQATVMSPSRFGKFRKQTDANNRPIIPASNLGPQNAAGVVNANGETCVNGLAGTIEGLPVYVTSSLAVAAAATESHYSFRPSDVILAESDLMQFRFEEVNGPQQIVLGIWRYAGVVVRQSGNGAKKVVVTSIS